MPRANTGDLSETLVCFSWKLLGSPAVGNALEAVTLGNSNDVDVLVFFEDGRDFNRLLKEAVSVVDLVSDRSSV